MADSYKFNPFTGKLDNAGGFTTPLNVTNAAIAGTPANPSKINTGDPTTKGLAIKGNAYISSTVLPSGITGLEAWWKADSLGLSDGTLISSWSDSSGGGYTATAAGIARPTFKTSIINGQPVVRFDGVENGFTVSIPIDANHLTCFFVISAASPSTSSLIFTDSGNYGFKIGSGGFYQFYNASPSADVATTAFQIIGFVQNSTNCTYYKNSIQDIQTAATPSSTTFDRIGKYQDTAPILPFQGDIAEIIVYNASLSLTDINKVNGYLGNKYGISVPNASINQTANLQEWQDPTGTVLSAVDSSGRLVTATSAGAPTGTPPAGTMVYDTTNHKLWVYDSGWKGVVLS